MCGRYSLITELNDLQGRFNFEAQELLYRPRYNLAPTELVLTVWNNGHNVGEFMHWGLIPFWAKDPKIGSRMINARGETVAEKPAFRRALRKRRCLVVADGFYEWKKEGKLRTPMYIRSRTGEPFAMAGLWEIWKAPSDEYVHSCTVVTTTANSLMEDIHDRMPVILPREAEETWLDTGIEDTKVLTDLLIPYPAEDLESYAVSNLVNSPKNDSPECLAPLVTSPLL
jgi:putative SOS response-associated peptidase YedK